MRADRVAAGLLLAMAWLAVPAVGQPEQWLGYGHAPDSERVIGATMGQTLELTDQRPAEVKLPKLTSSGPLFAKWKTPLVPAGFLWLALDGSGTSAALDRLYIDSNADGQLADETPAAAVDPRIYQMQQSAEFHDVRVMLPGPDGPSAYHLNFSLWVSRDSRRLIAKAAGWYEGNVTVGGTKCGCVLFDANANGTFNDAGADLLSSDRIKLETAGDYRIGRVGQFIQINGQFWAMQVAQDGSSIGLSQPKDTVFGTVRIRGGISQFSADGPTGLFLLSVEEGAAPLPVGKYKLSHWQIQRKDAAGVVWDLIAVAGEKAIAFEVAADKPAELEAGEPVVAQVSCLPGGTVYTFADPYLLGRLGERVLINRAGQPAPPPQLAVKNLDGSYGQKFGFQFG